MFQPTNIKLYTQSKTLFASSITVCTASFMPFIGLEWYNIFCFSDFLYTPGLTSIVVNQSWKCFKYSYFYHNSWGSSVNKNGVSNCLIHLSRLFCCWNLLHISESVSIIRQNMAVPVESAVKWDN